MLNAALLGYGQMGKMIESLSESHEVNILQKYWDERPLTFSNESENDLADVPVLIDFSIPDAALANIQLACQLGKNIVVGTTGWHARLNEARSLVEQANTGLVYGSNFSLGVNLFYKLADYASSLFSRFEEYDPYMVEGHHQFKKDAPSGTALVIQSIAQKYYADKEIPVSCIRSGFIPGRHALNFDSRVDSIQLEHSARSREGFASGALIAAKWIEGKTGFFAFQDVLDSILNNN